MNENFTLIFKHNNSQRPRLKPSVSEAFYLTLWSTSDYKRKKKKIVIKIPNPGTCA